MDITEKLDRKLFFILLSILLHLVKNSHKKRVPLVLSRLHSHPHQWKVLFFLMIVIYLFHIIHKYSFQTFLFLFLYLFTLNNAIFIST